MINQAFSFASRKRKTLVIGFIGASLAVISSTHLPVQANDRTAGSLSLNNNSTQASSHAASADILAAKMAQSTTKFTINASREMVWSVLTDFPSYPHIFRRLESCRITKQEGDLVWTESNLKPHVFVRTQRQLTVNDLSQKPNALQWKVINGNFKAVIGRWELSPAGRGDRCTVTYTLAVDPGPVMPKCFAAFALRNLQREIMSSLKDWVETTAVSSRTSLVPRPNSGSL